MQIIINVAKVAGLFAGMYAIVLTPYIADLVDLLLK